MEIHPSDEVLGHTGVEFAAGPLDDLNQFWLAKIGVHLGIRPLLDAGDELKDDVVGAEVTVADSLAMDEPHGQA